MKSRFATVGEIAACPPIAAELRRDDRVLHYEYWELDAVRRLERMYEQAQQPREFTRLRELQRAALLMEGRTAWCCSATGGACCGSARFQRLRRSHFSHPEKIPNLAAVRSKQCVARVVVSA